MVGQNTEVPNTNESLRQDVEQKPPYKFFGGDCHDSLFIAAGIVPPTELDAIAIEGDKTVVRNGHTMGIAAKITNHLVRTAKGRFGINDPTLSKQCAQKCGKAFRLSEVTYRSFADQPLFSV